MGHTIRFLDKNDVLPMENKNTSKNIYCNNHSIEALQMYCEDCECPVCYSCATGTHQGHKFVKISDVLEKSKKDLKKLIMKITKNQITGLQLNLEFMRQNKYSFYENVDSVIQEVEDQEKRLKQEVETICRNFIKRLKQRENDYGNLIHRIEHQIQELEMLVKTSEEKFHVVNEVDLVKFLTDSKQTIKKFEIAEPNIERISFLKQQNSQSEIEKLFGSLVYEPIKNVHLMPSIKPHVTFGNQPSSIGGKISPRHKKSELKREVTSKPHKVIEIMNSIKIQDEHFSPRH